VPSTETPQGMPQRPRWKAFSTGDPWRSGSWPTISATSAPRAFFFFPPQTPPPGKKRSGPFTRKEFLACARLGSTSTRRPPSPCSGTDRGAAVPTSREQDGAPPRCSAPGPTSTRRFPLLEPGPQGPSTSSVPDLKTSTIQAWVRSNLEQRIAGDFLPLQRASISWFRWNRSAGKFHPGQLDIPSPGRRPFVDKVVREDSGVKRPLRWDRFPAAEHSQRFRSAARETFFARHVFDPEIPGLSRQPEDQR